MSLKNELPQRSKGPELVDDQHLPRNLFSYAYLDRASWRQIHEVFEGGRLHATRDNEHTPLPARQSAWNCVRYPQLGLVKARCIAKDFLDRQSPIFENFERSLSGGFWWAKNALSTYWKMSWGSYRCRQHKPIRSTERCRLHANCLRAVNSSGLSCIKPVTRRFSWNPIPVPTFEL